MEPSKAHIRYAFPCMTARRQPLRVLASWTAALLVAGFAGVVYSWKVGTYGQSIGPGYLFPAVAAVFFGASQLKGRPNVWGAMIALYVGGMGARGKNFYNTLFTRYGYEAEAKEIQDLYWEGKKAEAAAAIPESFLLETSLVGEEGFVRDQIAKFKAAGVTMLNVAPVAADLEGQQALVAKVKELSE